MVLAAGSGRRFGGPKQLAVLDGEPLVGHVVATLLAADLDVVVVAGPFAGAVTDASRAAAAAVGRPDRLAVVVNEDFRHGIGASLAAAAQAAGPRPLVVALADQPGVVADDVRAVVAALRDGAEGVRIVHPEGPGHPVGFGAAAHAALLSLAADDGPPGPDDREAAGRDVLADLDVVEIVVDHPRPPDIDHPDDLAAVVASRADGPPE